MTQSPSPIPVPVQERLARREIGQTPSGQHPPSPLPKLTFSPCFPRTAHRNASPSSTFVLSISTTSTFCPSLLSYLSPDLVRDRDSPPCRPLPYVSLLNACSACSLPRSVLAVLARHGHPIELPLPHRASPEARARRTASCIQLLTCLLQKMIRRKKNVKKGIQFCLMVCGASGTGTWPHSRNATIMSTPLLHSTSPPLYNKLTIEHRPNHLCQHPLW